MPGQGNARRMCPVARNQGIMARTQFCEALGVHRAIGHKMDAHVLNREFLEQQIMIQALARMTSAQLAALTGIRLIDHNLMTLTGQLPPGRVERAPADDARMLPLRGAGFSA